MGLCSFEEYVKGCMLPSYKRGFWFVFQVGLSKPAARPVFTDSFADVSVGLLREVLVSQAFDTIYLCTNRNMEI